MHIDWFLLSVFHSACKQSPNRDQGEDTDQREMCVCACVCMCSHGMHVYTCVHVHMCMYILCMCDKGGLGAVRPDDKGSKKTEGVRVDVGGGHCSRVFISTTNC